MAEMFGVGAHVSDESDHSSLSMSSDQESEEDEREEVDVNVYLESIVLFIHHHYCHFIRHENMFFKLFLLFLVFYSTLYFLLLVIQA